MKKGQILEGYIERVDFPNKGFAVVEDEEKKVIVKNTVPEQKVRFAVNKIRKGQAVPHVQRAACRPFAFFGQVSVTPLPLCRLFAFIGNRSGRLFRHLFSLAGLGRFLGRLFEVGEVRGEIHGVADSLCSGMDCLLEITV